MFCFLLSVINKSHVAGVNALLTYCHFDYDSLLIIKKKKVSRLSKSTFKKVCIYENLLTLT